MPWNILMLILSCIKLWYLSKRRETIPKVLPVDFIRQVILLLR